MNSKPQSLLQQFERAVGKLSDVLGQKQDEYIRDSAIQRFEFTFELAWKTLKAFLEEQGMIELRNLTSHTYNEAIAEEIYRALPKILTLYMDLLAKLKKKIL